MSGPLSIMTGPRTALIIRPDHIPSVAGTWNGSLKGGFCACVEAPQAPKQTARAIEGLADSLEKRYIPNASESLGPILLGFHIRWCQMSFSDSVTLVTDGINHKDQPQRSACPWKRGRCEICFQSLRSRAVPTRFRCHLSHRGLGGMKQDHYFPF